MRKKILKNYIDGTSKDRLTQGINEIFEPISNEEKYDEEIQREGYAVIKNILE